MRRALVVLVLIAAACDSTEPSPTTPPVPTPTTTDRPARPAVEPSLPDGDSLAREPLDAIDAPSAEPDIDIEASARTRLALVLTSFAEGVASEWFRSDDELVLLFSVYPSGSARGDPSLSRAVASFLVEPSDPEPVAIGEAAGQRVSLDGLWWHIFATDTHLFVAIGPRQAPPAVLEELADRPGAYLWRAGDCLYFEDALPHAPFGEGNKVPCEGGHNWEVVAGTPIPDEADAPYPGDGLTERSIAFCEEAMAAYVGLLPNDTRLLVVRYLPDSVEWQEGDRYLACAAAERDQDGNALLTDRTLEGAGERVRAGRRPGDCYRSIDAVVLDCARVHAFEYIGPATLGPQEATYPGGTDVAIMLETACRMLIDEYTGSAVRPPADIDPLVLQLGEHAWDVGERSAPCFAIAVDEGGGLLEVRGSFGGDWEPIGLSEEGITV